MSLFDLLFGSIEERTERKLERLERDYDWALKDGDIKGAAYIHKEIKDVRRKAERKMGGFYW